MKEEINLEYLHKEIHLSIDNTPKNKKRYFTDAKTRDPYERARTFQGIADAMAEQWG